MLFHQVFRKITLSVFSLVAASLISIDAVASDYYWRSPITNHTNITAKIWASQDGVYYFDMAPSMSFQNNDLWNVNDMTSAGIAFSPTYQASTNPRDYGATSIQWQGDKFSTWLHSWSVTPSVNPLVNYWSIAYGGYIPGDNRAWNSSNFGNSPQLCSAHFQKVTKLYTQGTIVFHNYASILIKDAATNQNINLVVAIWDNRPQFDFESDKGIRIDVQSGHFVQSYIGDQRYTTMMPWSQSAQSGGERPEEWYGFCITKENLLNIINDFNDIKIGVNTTKLSTNPNNYTLQEVYLQSEAGNIRNPMAVGHVGIVMRENWVFTRY